MIIRIPKKGPLIDCNNWPSITLLSIPSKILAKIIINRLSNVVDRRLREEQAGFRKGKGCIDQIFALRNIIEQCTEWQRKLCINFMDFKFSCAFQSKTRMRDISTAFQHQHRLGHETNNSGQKQRNALESIYQPGRPRFCR